MEEICIPKDQVPADILHRLKAIGQRVQQTQTTSSGQAPVRGPSTSVTSERNASSYDEVDGGYTSDRRTDIDCGETQVISGSKEVPDRSRLLGGGDVVSVLTRNPEQRIEQCPQSGGQSSQQDVCQELLVLQHQQQHPQQQQQPFQNLQQLHQAQLNLREPQGPYAKKLSPFKTHLINDVQNDSRVDVSGQRSRSPSKADVDLKDMLTQRLLGRSPFISGNASEAFQCVTRDPALRCASLGQASTRTDDDIVRVFPLPSGAASGEVGHQQSPKLLTPPETPDCEGKRTGRDVFTFDDLTCAEELMRQTLERMHQLKDRTPVRRDIMGLYPQRHVASQSIRRGVCQGALNKPPLSAPADLHLLQSSDTPVRKKLKLEALPCSSCPQASQCSSFEDYHLQQRRNSLSPQPKRKLTFEHGTGSALFLHSLPHQPRSYDTSGAPYPPSSPRQSVAASAGSEGDVGRGDFSFCTHAHDGQQVLMGGRTSTPGKLLASFASELPCFQDRAGLNSGSQLHGRGVLSYGEEDVDGPQSLYFQSPHYSYVPGDRTAPKRRRAELDVMEDERDIAYCTCAVMERHFLQMAECAYKCIHRLDSSAADFDRFRTELAQTNEILREAMELMQRIREMCEHRPRARR